MAMLAEKIEAFGERHERAAVALCITILALAVISIAVVAHFAIVLTHLPPNHNTYQECYYDTRFVKFVDTNPAYNNGCHYVPVQGG